MPELLVPDDLDERQEIDQISPSALAILNQSEHAAMVQTANFSSNRRSVKSFDNRLKEYATYSQPIALSMFYSLPRAGKQIIGPSVRFAEVVAPCWRNCAVASRAIGDSASTVTAQGIFIDYEVNLRNSIEVPRRITDKDGKRYNDDMIVTTVNAAMSVARRNAVLKGGVPQALWTPAYEDAQLTAVGKAMSHAQRVSEAMEYLHKLGVNEWQILNSVGVPSPKELETEHLLTLRVLCAEVKRGEKTIEEVFGSPYDKEIEALFTQLKMNDTQQRMLRQSYMGRAKELAEYLRTRLGPAQTARMTPVAPPPAAPAPAVETQPAPAAVTGEWPQQDVEEAPPIPSPHAPEPPPLQAVWPEAAPAPTEPEGGTNFEFGENASKPDPEPAPAKRGRGRPRQSAQPEPVQGPGEQPQQPDEQDDQFAF